jgi:putative endonuclease
MPCVLLVLRQAQDEENGERIATKTTVYKVDLILSLSKDEVVHGAWVYILRCSDGMYYVGSHRGDDPQSRASEHNAGLDPKAFTYKRRPVEVVWAEHFDLIVDAIAAERRLKGWSRAKKEAVIRGDWDALPGLSRSRNPRPSTSSG